MESSIPKLCVGGARFRIVKLSVNLRLVARSACPNNQERHMGPYCIDPKEGETVLNVNVEAKALTITFKSSENSFQHHSL